jgi:hypothetical protein
MEGSGSRVGSCRWLSIHENSESGKLTLDAAQRRPGTAGWKIGLDGWLPGEGPKRGLGARGPGKDAAKGACLDSSNENK